MIGWRLTFRSLSHEYSLLLEKHIIIPRQASTIRCLDDSGNPDSVVRCDTGNQKKIVVSPLRYEQNPYTFNIRPLTINVKQKSNRILASANPFYHVSNQIFSGKTTISRAECLFESVLPLPVKKDHDLIQQNGYQNLTTSAYLGLKRGSSVSTFSGESYVQGLMFWFNTLWLSLLPRSP